MPMAVGFLAFVPERFTNPLREIPELLGESLEAPSILRADVMVATKIFMRMI